jgi:hypothetical protein
MFYPTGTSGVVKTDESGRRRQTIWSDNYLVRTYERDNNGNEDEPSLRKRIYLGDFSINETNWDLENSTLDFMGSFDYFPSATKTTEINDYPYETISTSQQDVVSGVYYKIPLDANRPLLDESTYEHSRTLLFKYSNFGEFSGITRNMDNSEAQMKPTGDRSIFSKYNLEDFLPDEWWKNPFKQVSPVSDQPGNPQQQEAISSIIEPSNFKKKTADKITNFNPSTDSLEIDTDSFGMDSSATFAAGKNKKAVKKQLAKQDFDFLYDQKKGGLYFNENGSDKGFGDGGIIAILKGAPDLTMDNIDFV